MNVLLKFVVIVLQGDEYALPDPSTTPHYQKTPTPVQSPYRVLPPIGSADTDQVCTLYI